MLSPPATTTPVAIPAKPRNMVAPKTEKPVLTTLKMRDCERRIPRTYERALDLIVLSVGWESRGRARSGQTTGSLPEPTAVMAVLIQPMIKSTIMTVAAVAARLTVLCRDCLSVATRGTETSAVPTVRDDGIELVILVRPVSKGQVSVVSWMQQFRRQNSEPNSQVVCLPVRAAVQCLPWPWSR